MFLNTVTRQSNMIGFLPTVKSTVNMRFDQQLSSAKSAAGNYVVPLKDDNFVFYIGHGDGQDVYVEYTKESTPDDPIVRITGHSLNGAFDFTAHIHDIDPGNASYAELCAFIGHQKQSGAFEGNAALGIFRPTPLGMPVGDFTQKVNYLSKSQQYLSSGKVSDSIYNQGRELLRLYQKDMDKRGYTDRPLPSTFQDRMVYELLRTIHIAGISRSF